MVEVLSDAVAIWRLAHAPATLQHFSLDGFAEWLTGGDVVRAA